MTALLSMDERSERIGARQVAAITGYSVRTIELMATRGEIPSAARLRSGGRWTFETDTIRRWIKQREEMSCRGISIKETAFGGCVSRLPAVNIDAAYERALGRAPKSGATRSLRN